MKILKIVFIALWATLVLACEQVPERLILESWNANQPKLVGYFVEIEGKRIKTKEEKFYENGTLEYYGSFDDQGRREGEWRYYYDSGQLWSLGSYKNGLNHGKKEVYWPDGTKRYEGQFTDDTKSGTWIFYNPDGTVYEKKQFDVIEAK